MSVRTCFALSVFCAALMIHQIVGCRPQLPGSDNECRPADRACRSVDAGSYVGVCSPRGRWYPAGDMNCRNGCGYNSQDAAVCLDASGDAHE